MNFYGELLYSKKSALVTTLKRGTKEIDVFLPFADFELAYNNWKNGMLIQNAFPTLTVNQREFILTGMSPDEWEDMFRTSEGMELEVPDGMPFDEWNNYE